MYNTISRRDFLGMAAAGTVIAASEPFPLFDQKIDKKPKADEPVYSVPFNQNQIPGMKELREYAAAEHSKANKVFQKCRATNSFEQCRGNLEALLYGEETSDDIIEVRLSSEVSPFAMDKFDLRYASPHSLDIIYRRKDGKQVWGFHDEFIKGEMTIILPIICSPNADRISTAVISADALDAFEFWGEIQRARLEHIQLKAGFPITLGIQKAGDNFALQYHFPQGTLERHIIQKETGHVDMSYNPVTQTHSVLGSGKWFKMRGDKADYYTPNKAEIDKRIKEFYEQSQALLKEIYHRTISGLEKQGKIRVKK